jgi:acyl transferase domain-containing protein
MHLSEAAAHSNIGQNVANHGDLEPIAIIGLSFQFPQGAVTEDAFWDMLVNRRNASTEYPKERMNIDAFYSKDPKKPNTVGLVWLPGEEIIP